MGEAAQETTRTVPTVCGICGYACGVNVHLQDGQIVKIDGSPEHAISRGYFCHSAVKFVDTAQHADRLKYPLKRVGTEWRRVSWEEALGEIAERLQKTKDTYGARSLAVSMGQKMITQGPTAFAFIRRFSDAFGTPNVYSSDSFCWRATIIADLLTLGRVPNPDILNSKCVLIWGTNPNEGNTPRSPRVREARSKGAKTIVVDPRITPEARKADVHLRLRPGTDAALLLGMANVIVSESLYDKDFVAKWTVGFDQFVERVKEYPPERVEQITWVPADDVRRAARLYAATKPACFMVGFLGFQETRSGVHACRTINILQAITGNLDVEGGSIIPSGGLRLNSLRLSDGMAEKPLLTEKNPLFYEVNGVVLADGEGQITHLPDAILTGQPYPIKAMIVSGQDPILAWPETHKTQRALRNLDLLVVMDLFMTETAKLADFVLPASSWLEKTNLFDHYRQLTGIPFALLQKKAIQYHESLPDTEFYLALAKKLGYTEQFPWDNYDRVLDYVLEPAGLSVQKLTEEMPKGGMFGKMSEHRIYEKKGFRTPSGKVEIFSETLQSLGHDPLPVYLEPTESPVSRPDLAKDYPIVLVVGTRKSPWSGSMFRNVPRMRKIDPNPAVEIHPATAEQCGVQQGDRVLLETVRGSISLFAEVSDEALPGVATVSSGWAEANANLLTECAAEDPISGFPRRMHLCRIRKNA